jgi:flagellin
MAEAMVEFSKQNILAQVGESVLAQANQNNQGILSLIR